MKADWYFDFISPYSYLQHAVLHRLPDDLEVTMVPVLFAGLLGHWGHKGPAELPTKRVFTYRQCQWWANRNAVRFRFPPGHPFNPIKVLRLAIALGSEPGPIDTIFRFIWVDGRDPNADWPDLAAALGITAEDADARIQDQAVKDALRANTDAAIAKGVFGVPTFAINGELIWGVDATEMVADFVDNPLLFNSDEMKRISTLPAAAQRKT